MRTTRTLTISLSPAMLEPTKREVTAIRRGRDEIRRGDYVTLEQLHHELAPTNRKSRQKSPRKAAR